MKYNTRMWSVEVQSRFSTRMTRIARIFTDMRASASSVASMFYRNTSAFIMPKPCGFSTPRTHMPCGAYVYTPAPKATLLDVVPTYALRGHTCMRPPEARLWRLVTLGAFICVHLRLYLVERRRRRWQYE
jgi:hypothetical protein